MSNEEINILYLDDEPNNLTSFKAAFRREFNIFTTTNANEAVQMLSENDIQIVISDQKMPDISGVEFFELITKDFPHPVRMLLTGYADIEAVIDAINRGQVYRYIAKPWDENDLRITIRNAFDIYKTRKELREKNRDLERAYNELEKFVYSASHDLRAPLASILGVIKLARAEGEHNHYLEMIESSVGKLDNFVQNIINYYQNSNKEEILNKVDFDLLVDEVYEHFRHIDGADEVRLLKKVEQEGDISLDEMRLKIVLNNLVNNAIKYRDSEKEQPFVEVAVRNTREKVMIRVKDNGIGIEEKNIPLIFDMFYRESDSTELGTGIGLYITQEAIDKMNGTIEVKSTPKEGTTFLIEVPNKLNP
jgi:signal transduction histidine kinase